MGRSSQPNNTVRDRCNRLNKSVSFYNLFMMGHRVNLSRFLTLILKLLGVCVKLSAVIGLLTSYFDFLVSDSAIEHNSVLTCSHLTFLLHIQSSSSNSNNNELWQLNNRHPKYQI